MVVAANELTPEQLKQALKAMIIEECDKGEAEVADIADDEVLIGGPLELDSLDALQICMAVKQYYGVRIEGGPEARKALQSVQTLAATILEAGIADASA
ncbi:MAG TPA: acyl carrier protein [Porticoccus sp.]|nr:acyl carrier protein [Porticoccus sp.]